MIEEVPPRKGQHNDPSSPGMHRGMLCTDWLKDVAMHSALNAAQKISAQNIHVVRLGFFELNRRLCVALCPQEMVISMPYICNPGRRLSRCDSVAITMAALPALRAVLMNRVTSSKKCPSPV